MLVQQAAARREIQQHGAGEHRQYPAPGRSSEDSCTQFHEARNQPNTLDANHAASGVES